MPPGLRHKQAQPAPLRMRELKEDGRMRLRIALIVAMGLLIMGRGLRKRVDPAAHTHLFDLRRAAANRDRCHSGY